MTLANLRNREKLCAFDGCPKLPAYPHTSAAGKTIFYCLEHRIDVESHFSETTMYRKKLAAK